jgi:hypothetical protein
MVIGATEIALIDNRAAFDHEKSLRSSAPQQFDQRVRISVEIVAHCELAWRPRELGSRPAARHSMIGKYLIHGSKAAGTVGRQRLAGKYHALCGIHGAFGI